MTPLAMYWELHSELMNGSYEFSDWESEFLESICDQLDNDKKLSEKQRNVISKLYSKVYDSSW